MTTDTPKADDDFDCTSGDLARKAGTLTETVREYGDKGWIPCKRLPNGTRLFRSRDASAVQKIKAERLANRGRRADAA